MTAFRKAKQLSPWVVVEEELSGMVYRATLIGGELFGVIRREPPNVIGDGISTVRQLVDNENVRNERHGSIFHIIADGEAADAELVRQGLSWDSVPAPGQMVFLNQKVSRGVGASTTDVTEIVHPENKILFERIAKLLNDSLVGVDFIIEDITKPWHDTPACGVIECNSLPFIDLHHYPLNGSPRNAAGALWDILVSGSPS